MVRCLSCPKALVGPPPFVRHETRHPKNAPVTQPAQYLKRRHVPTFRFCTSLHSTHNRTTLSPFHPSFPRPHLSSSPAYDLQELPFKSYKVGVVSAVCSRFAMFARLAFHADARTTDVIEVVNISSADRSKGPLAPTFGVFSANPSGALEARLPAAMPPGNFIQGLMLLRLNEALYFRIGFTAGTLLPALWWFTSADQ